jgi:pimeloyl-ACP methyl ester carboxylesterase
MPALARRTAALMLPGWLPRSVWPFETVQLNVDGSAIAVSEAGAGPILLFYTGIGSFVWRDVMLRLSAGFRCVVLDPPGIGLSAPVPRSATTLANSSRAVTAVIRDLDLRDITLVVHDTGAPPALAAAARMPERVRGLVGVNTFGWKPSGPAFRGMLAVMGSSLVRRADIATGLLARVTSSAFGVGRHLNEDSRRAYRAGLTRSMGAFHDYLRQARSSDEIYEEITGALTGRLRDLPLLTIFGERNDPLGFQPQWKRLFPNARQLVIAKGNHFPMCDDPDFVSDAIRSWHHETLPGLSAPPMRDER